MPPPGMQNPVDFLYKSASQRGMPAPCFEELAAHGPPNMRSYIMQCTFWKITAQGQGRTKKEAKQEAAKAIKARMDTDMLQEWTKTQQVT